MSEQHMTFRLELPGVPVGQLRQFHGSPEALAILTPPGTLVRVEGDLGPLREGQRLTLVLRKFGWPLRWHAINETVSESGFTDRMLQGPFRSWRHQHRFLAIGAGSRLEDEVHFSLPWQPLSNLVLPLIRRDVRQLFAFRHRATLAALTGPPGTG